MQIGMALPICVSSDGDGRGFWIVFEGRDMFAGATFSLKIAKLKHVFIGILVIVGETAKKQQPRNQKYDKICN